MKKIIIFVASSFLSIFLGWLAWVYSSDSLDKVSTAKVDQALSSKRVVSRKIFSESGQVKEQVSLDNQLNSARKLVDSGEIDQGSKLLLEIIGKNPSNIEALLEISLIELLDRGRPKEALPYLVRALRIDPKNDHLLGEVAKIYLETSQVEDGLKFFESLSQHLPNTAAINLRLGQLYYYNRDFDKSLNTLKSIELSEEYGVYAQSIEARIKLSLGDINSGLLQFKAVERKVNDKIRVAMQRGETVDFLVDWLETMQVEASQYLIRYKMYKEAEVVLYRLSERIPADPEVMQLLDLAKAGKINQAG